ncbi:hypothetical protein MA16_Dca006840 [Dendrobium catenatum]|uniref:Uncharacterized protein n=1 Tax=Dendrobium catenatum TaxID=906689 RepID=A0A2I0VSX9_9ASPA|nr:hypothetical protein MA16_Dca006840 [Dendrobium catenatum]
MGLTKSLGLVDCVIYSSQKCYPRRLCHEALRSPLFAKTNVGIAPARRLILFKSSSSPVCWYVFVRTRELVALDTQATKQPLSAWHTLPVEATALMTMIPLETLSSIGSLWFFDRIIFVNLALSPLNFIEVPFASLGVSFTPPAMQNSTDLKSLFKTRDLRSLLQELSPPIATRKTANSFTILWLPLQSRNINQILLHGNSTLPLTLTEFSSGASIWNF